MKVVFLMTKPKFKY